MGKYNKKELEKLILEQNKSYSSIGKLYNVSGNAIKKAAKKHRIPLPRRRKVNENEDFTHKGYRQHSLVNKVSDDEFISIIKESKQWVDVADKLGYKNYLSSNVKDSIKNRCSMLGIELNLEQRLSVSDLTKGEFFENRKNWQSARGGIQKDSRRVYFKSNPTPRCEICGYSNHVEVAHIKAVSDFDDSTTISEINSLSNLIGLCPNHHWELDNGYLKI